MDKNTLRMKAKIYRSRLNLDVISEKIVERIMNLPQYSSAKNVLLFYPKANELNLLKLCEADKNFYLPRISGEDLLVCPFDCNVKMQTSVFKTLEPCSNPVLPEIIDFAVIPCLMADKNCYRLGYGGGFYDRFLQDFGGKTVCCINKNLVVKTIFPEEHDIKMDIIIL